MKYAEMFYSLQGEGGRAGEASLFIRLTGCSAKHACAASGVVCDTEFESGLEVSVEQLIDVAKQAVKPMLSDNALLPWIVWTGGEPLDQLTPEIISQFRRGGFAMHAIETSGVRPMSLEMRRALDYVVVSPKVAEHILVKHFPWAAIGGAGTDASIIDELRYPRHAGQPGVPQPLVRAVRRYISPHSDGNTINRENLQHCIQLCLSNPSWSLSVQQHKLWKVL